MTMDEFMLLVEKYEAKCPIENTLRHFGYPEDIKTTLYRQWDKSEYLKKLSFLPEYIDFALQDKPFKLVFDYDPDYPDTLIQIFLKDEA